MAITVARQETLTITRGVVFTIPARVGRKSMTIQAPRGSYWIGLGQDPIENQSLVARISRESYGTLQIDAAFPANGNNTDFYEGDVRILYTGNEPTRDLWVVELT